MTAIEDDRAARPPRIALYRNPRARSIFVQALVVLLLLWLGWELIANARSNLAAEGHHQRLRFPRSQRRLRRQPVADSLTARPIAYRRLYVVGLLNTLLVAVLGIIFATILGFIIGIARLSQQLAAGADRRRLCRDLIRNLPLLFQLLFWYLAVLGTLPATRESISLFDVIFLNNRGVVLPRPIFGDGAG